VKLSRLKRKSNSGSKCFMYPS